MGGPEIGAAHKSQKVGGLTQPARPNRLYRQWCGYYFFRVKKNTHFHKNGFDWLESLECVFLFFILVWKSMQPSVLWCCSLGSRKGIRPVKKLSGGLLVCLSVWSEVQTCTWSSWCHCHSLSLALVKSRILVLPFWYQLTWVVPDKGPFNACVYVCVYSCMLLHQLCAYLFCFGYLFVLMAVPPISNVMYYMPEEISSKMDDCSAVCHLGV